VGEKPETDRKRKARLGVKTATRKKIRGAEQKVGTAQTLKESELRYRRLFETAQDGILILDARTGAIDDVNPYLIDMLGYSRAEFLKKKLWEVGAFKDVEASKLAFQALQKNQYIRYKDLPLRSKSGKLLQVEFVSNVYLVGEKKVIQCNIRDITDRKQAQDALIESEALLREQSVRDHLTGLFNRRYLEETLGRELLRAERKQISIGVMMLDVDGFKGFNDTWGHAAGDAVLRELGALLLSHVRGDDIACRYGGDEFVIVLPDASRDITRERAQRLCEHARNFKVQYERQTLGPVTLSIGVAVFPQNGSTSTEVLKAADAALYRSKHKGAGRVAVEKE
jgi:diguanylate cyclase (GGDEF)-like protein/PAS domain S-box-containing protein